jgi:sortase A
MRTTAAAIGRTLVAVGALLLLFVGFQLWGTGILTARAQDDLEDELARLQAEVHATTSTTGDTGTTGTTGTTEPGATTTTAPGGTVSLPPIHSGDPLGRIQIPRIGVDWVYVQGTSRDDLKKGPGHYPATPLPGQIGNAAIAGHRTTYGAPFNRLDELAAGDLIVIDSLLGQYVYVVREQLVVQPTDISVADNTPGPELTLTTCNPEYSARERLVIKADMVVERSDEPVAGDALPIDDTPSDQLAAGLEEGLAGDEASRAPALAWGLVVTIVGLAWWFVYRRYRHPLTWFAGVVPFLAVLFVFFVYLERVLPAGY